ncbi:limbic system-associated membrane protein isoform X2 [Camponotus floridanus]|uniref:limbic system-associated membrane protein isoform X2 n=1 Tax=Camponotus floridanus TaxID=104421 RepID=UPI0009716888|nr:limbic system-associated membrane protein isoform X2 [Camponotus floridanus]
MLRFVIYAWIFYIYDLFMIGTQATVNSDFQSYPTTVKTYENDTVLLPCYVEDQGAQTRIKWWREETLLADSSERNRPKESPERIIMYQNGTLQILNVQREDSGQYVCQVTRLTSWGGVTQLHKLEVMYPPSVETIPASGELEVNLGETVYMQCVAKGVPTPIISWRTEEGEIPLLDVRSQLSFRAENRNLSGRYTCVATNEVSDPAIAHIDLRIRYKPEIFVKKPWVHAYPGIRAQLNCIVTAWPEAKVDWYFRNETLKYTSRVVKYSIGNDYRLMIRNVNESDYGSYLCRASNSLGFTEKIIELSGIANQAIFKKESRSTSSTSYNFIWEVDSYYPIIEYQFWFRKYKDTNDKWRRLHIPGDNDVLSSVVHVRSFNLTGLDAATHYEATVLSRTQHGWSHPSAILHFHTEGASVDSSENFETDDDQKNRIAVIQLASMSQHYPLATDANGSTYYQVKTLLLISCMSCTLIISFDGTF